MSTRPVASRTATATSSRSRTTTTSSGKAAVTRTRLANVDQPSSRNGAHQRVLPERGDSLDTTSQQHFLNTAAGCAYPYVQKWLTDTANDFSSRAVAEARHAQVDEEVAVATHHKHVLASRGELAQHKVAGADRQRQYASVCEAARRARCEWWVSFHDAAQAYLDGLSETEANLLDRRTKALQWSAAGQKEAVRATISRFRDKRHALAKRAQQEAAQASRTRQKEQHRMRLALESCMVEVRNVIAWHTQQQPRTTATATFVGSDGGEEVVRRRRQLLAMLGGAAAVKAYLSERGGIGSAPGEVTCDDRGRHTSTDMGGAGVCGCPALPSVSTATMPRPGILLRHGEATDVVRRSTCLVPIPLHANPPAVASVEGAGGEMWRQSRSRAGITSRADQWAARWLANLVEQDIVDEQHHHHHQPQRGVAVSRALQDNLAIHASTLEDARDIAQEQALRHALHAHLARSRHHNPTQRRVQQQKTQQQALQNSTNAPIPTPAHRRTTDGVTQPHASQLHRAAEGLCEEVETVEEEEGEASSHCEPSVVESSFASVLSYDPIADPPRYDLALLTALDAIAQNVSASPRLTQAGVLLSDCHGTPSACPTAVPTTACQQHGRPLLQARPKAIRPSPVQQAATATSPPHVLVKKGLQDVQKQSNLLHRNALRRPVLSPIAPPAKTRTQRTALDLQTMAPEPSSTRQMVSLSSPQVVTRALCTSSSSSLSPCLASQADAVWSDEGSTLRLEPLDHLVEALAEERKVVKETVRVKANLSVALLDRLKMLHAMSAEVSLSNTELEQCRKALLIRRQDGQVRARVVGGGAALLGSGVNLRSTSGQMVAGTRQFAGIMKDNEVNSNNNVSSGRKDVVDAENVRRSSSSVLCARAELVEALADRRRMLERTEAAVGTLSARVRASAIVQDGAASYWRQCATALHDSTKVHTTLADGIPALGLHTAQDVADFISAVL